MRGTPLISTRVPPVTLTLTSSRAAPIPVRTLPVAPDEPAQDLADLGRFLGGPHVRGRYGLDKGHAEPVREIDAPVADIADLAAGVLLQPQLNDPDVAPLVRDLAVDADDGRPLEPGGDAPVQVLFAGDMEFVDHLAGIEHPDAQSDVQRLLVELEGRRVVHFVSADRLAIDPVDDLLFRLELHEGRAVVLAELGERGPHVTEDLGVERVAQPAGRTAAKELLRGQELLVDLQAGLEADGRVVLRGHLLERLENKFVRGRGSFQTRFESSINT